MFAVLLFMNVDNLRVDKFIKECGPNIYSFELFSLLCQISF